MTHIWNIIEDRGVPISVSKNSVIKIIGHSRTAAAYNKGSAKKYIV